MAMLSNLAVYLTGNSSGYDRMLVRSRYRTRQWARSIQNTMRTALGALGFVGVGYALRSMGRAYADQEKADQRLAAVLRATGGAAGFTMEQLKGQAAALQRVTTTGDETIQRYQAILLTFRNIKGDQFSQATELVLDMAEVMGGAEAAAKMLGKALNDPASQVGFLARAGVSFSQVQKDQIRNMQEQGDLLGAQKLVLAELRQEFGGVARAMAEGPGQVDQARNAWSDLKEAVGGALVQSLNLYGRAGEWAQRLYRWTDAVRARTADWAMVVRGFGIDFGAAFSTGWTVARGAIGNVGKYITSTIANAVSRVQWFGLHWRDVFGSALTAARDLFSGLTAKKLLRPDKLAEEYGRLVKQAMAAKKIPPPALAKPEFSTVATLADEAAKIEERRMAKWAALKAEHAKGALGPIKKDADEAAAKVDQVRQALASLFGAGAEVGTMAAARAAERLALVGVNRGGVVAAAAGGAGAGGEKVERNTGKAAELLGKMLGVQQQQQAILAAALGNPVALGVMAL